MFAALRGTCSLNPMDKVGLTCRNIRWAALLLAVVMWGCSALISPYDHTAYQQATAVKAEALSLVKKSGEPYSKHEAQVDQLLLNVDKAYEYAKGLPANSITVKQWKILRDELIAGFVETWKKQGKVSDEYAIEKALQISEGFDYIICLEINKKEATACSELKKTE